MAFLEIVFLVVAIYAITQLMLPLAMPKDFQTNWLFKGRRKPKVDPNISKAVDDLAQQKALLEAGKKEVLTQAEQQLKDAEDLKNKANSL